MPTKKKELPEPDSTPEKPSPIGGPQRPRRLRQGSQKAGKRSGKPGPAGRSRWTLLGRLRPIAKVSRLEFRKALREDSKLRVATRRDRGKVKKLLLKEISRQLPLKRGARRKPLYNRVELLWKKGKTLHAILSVINPTVHLQEPQPRDVPYDKLTKDEQWCERERIKRSLKKRRQKRREKSRRRAAPDPENI